MNTLPFLAKRRRRSRSASKKPERARLARHVTGHSDAYLSATQLGVTLASLGLGWLGEPFLADMIEPFSPSPTSPRLC